MFKVESQLDPTAEYNGPRILDSELSTISVYCLNHRGHFNDWLKELFSMRIFILSIFAFLLVATVITEKKHPGQRLSQRASADTTYSKLIQHKTLPQKKQLPRLIPFQKGRKWGYQNQKGKILILPQFDGAQPFSEGLGCVKVGDKWGYINTTASFVIGPSYEKAFPLREGRALVGSGSEFQSRYGYIDKTGQEVISLQYFFAHSFSQGLALVKNTRWIYIDKNGRRAFSLDFSSGKDFSEGLGAVKIGEKWAFVDLKGNVVIPARFDRVEPFREGKALVQLKGKEFFIDHKGRVME